MEKLDQQFYDAVLQQVKSIRANGFREKSPNVPPILPIGPVIGQEHVIPTNEGDIKVYLHNPNNVKKAPVYFNFHGGGMSAGTAQQDEFICHDIAISTNVIVINVEYPLAPEHPYPHGLSAAYQVILYMLENADQYAIDKDLVAFGGYSAGACIAVALAEICNYKKEIAYKGVTCCYPGFDFSTPDMLAGRKLLDSVSNIYGYSYFANGGDLKDPIACPIYAEENYLKDIPSALIMSGEIDPLRPQAEAFTEKLMKSNVLVIYKQFKNCAHGFTHRAYDKEPHQVVSLTSAYLKNIFVGK